MCFREYGGAAGEVLCTSLTGDFKSPELCKRGYFKNIFLKYPLLQSRRLFYNLPLYDIIKKVKLRGII